MKLRSTLVTPVSIPRRQMAWFCMCCAGLMVLFAAPVRAGWATFRGGTVKETVPAQSGSYRLHEDIFYRRSDDGIAREHGKLGRGPHGMVIDPGKGLPEITHPLNRFGGILMRPAFFVLDGQLVSWDKVFAVGNRHRRTLHNLGLRSFEAFSPDSPWLDPNQAAMVFQFYEVAYGPKGPGDNFKAPSFRVFRVEFKDGVPVRGWTLRMDYPWAERNKVHQPGAAVPFDVGGLSLEEGVVTGALAVPESAECYQANFEVKGAAVAGVFTGSGAGSRAVGGIVGELDYGYADLTAPPEWEILVINPLGPNRAGEDDLIVSFQLIDGTVTEAKLRCPGKDRMIDVKKTEIKLFDLVCFAGSVTASIDGADYTIRFNNNKLGVPFHTGLLGTDVVRQGFTALRDGDAFVVEGSASYVMALVRNAWQLRLAKKDTGEASEK